MKRNQLFNLVICMGIILMATTVSAQKNDNIQITRFEIKKINNQKAGIDWATDNKVVTNYFEVEKSLDGENFKTIAYVLGPDPKKEGDQYECFDKVSDTKVFYRLKHVSVDGAIQYSNIKTIAL